MRDLKTRHTPVILNTLFTWETDSYTHRETTMLPLNKNKSVIYLPLCPFKPYMHSICLLFYAVKMNKDWGVQASKRTHKNHYKIIPVAYCMLRSPLKDIVVGKNQSEWKKFRVGGKNIFQMFCVLSQNFCVPSRNFAFSRKTFAFSRKDICVPSQNFCFLS